MASYLDKYRQQINQGGGAGTTDYSQTTGPTYLQKYRQGIQPTEQEDEEDGIRGIVEKGTNFIQDVTAPVRKFVGETTSSAFGGAFGGGEFTLSLIRDIPRKLSENNFFLDSPVRLGKGEIQKDINNAINVPNKFQDGGFTRKPVNPQWLSNTLNAWETSFDKAKEEGPKGPRIQNPFGTASFLLDKAQQKNQEFREFNTPDFQKDQEFMQKYANAPLQEKLTRYFPQTLRMLAPDVAGSFITVLATKRLTGSTFAGSSVLAASTGNDIKESAEEYGVPKDRATMLGLSAAIPIALLEKVGFDAVIGKGFLQNWGKGFTGRIIKSMVAEGVTEVTQEDIQQHAESTFREIGADEDATRDAMAALGGVLGGGFFAGTAEVFNTSMGTKGQDTDMQQAVKAYEQKGEAQPETKRPSTEFTENLNRVIEQSEQAPIIREALNLQPSESAVLSEPFVESVINDLKPQTRAFLTDTDEQQKIENSIDQVRGKEYKTMGELLNEVDRVLPPETDEDTRDLMLGQSFLKAQGLVDEQIGNDFIQHAFSNIQSQEDEKTTKYIYDNFSKQTLPRTSPEATGSPVERLNVDNVPVGELPEPEQFERELPNLESLPEEKRNRVEQLDNQRKQIISLLPRYEEGSAPAKSLTETLNNVDNQIAVELKDIQIERPESKNLPQLPQTPAKPQSKQSVIVSPAPTTEQVKEVKQQAKKPRTEKKSVTNFVSTEKKSLEKIQEDAFELQMRKLRASEGAKNKTIKRGANEFKIKIAQRAQKGEITKPEQKMLETFVDRWEEKLVDVAPNFWSRFNERRFPNQPAKQGEFDVRDRVVRVFLDNARSSSGVTRATVHETMHAMEDYLTSRERTRILNQFEKKKEQYFNSVPEQELKNFQRGIYNDENYRYVDIAEYTAELFTDKELSDLEFNRIMKDGTALEKFVAIIHRLVHGMINSVNNITGKDATAKILKNIRNRKIRIAPQPFIADIRNLPSLERRSFENQLDQVRKGIEIETEPGYSQEDYSRLTGLLDSELMQKAGISESLISRLKPNQALYVARQSRLSQLTDEEIIGLFQIMDAKGKPFAYKRFSRLADIIGTAKKLSGNKIVVYNTSDLIDRVARIDNEYEAEAKRADTIEKAYLEMIRLANKSGLVVPDNWIQLKNEAVSEAERLKKESVGAIVHKSTGQPMRTNEYLNEEIKQKLEKARTESADGNINVAKERLQEINEIQAVSGKQENQVDLSRVDDLFAEGKVEEGLALQEKLMRDAGFSFVNGQWLHQDSKRKPKFNTPKSIYTREGLLDRVREQDINSEERAILDSMFRGIEKDYASVDKQMNDDRFLQQLKKGLSKQAGSPWYRLPSVWREVLLPMENYQSFVQNQIVAAQEIYKKHKIKPNSESDMRIKRLKDGTATLDDTENVTKNEKAALEELDALTNKWFDTLLEESPRVLKSLKDLRTDIESELKQKMDATLKRVEEEHGRRIKQVVDDNILMNFRRLDSSLAAGYPEREDIRSLAYQLYSLNDAIEFNEENMLTEERRVRYFVPRYKMEDYEDNRNKYISQKNFSFASLNKREADLTTASDNAGLLTIFQKYIRGMGSHIYLTEMYARATREAEKLQPDIKAEAREYVQMLNQPSNVGTISSLLTRSFSTGQLGLRTQLKNFAYGQSSIFAETGLHYLRAMKMITRNPKEFARRIKGLNFLDDVTPVIYGTIGQDQVSGKFLQKKIERVVDKIQDVFPGTIIAKRVEVINRSIAHVAGQLQAEAQGLNKEDAEFHAWNVVTKTQFIYGKHSMPKMFRGKGSNYTRLTSQYIATRLRDTEMILHNVANKNWGYVIRLYSSRAVLFALLAAMWPEEKRVTAEGDEYKRRGIDFWEGVDTFDLRKIPLAYQKDVGALENIWNTSTAMLNGWMSPAVQLFVHAMGIHTGLDNVFRSGNTAIENVMEDLQGLIPQKAVATDVMTLLRGMGLVDPEPNYSLLSTPIAVDGMIKEAQKAGNQNEVNRLKKTYPIYQYANLAKIYESKIDKLKYKKRSERDRIKKQLQFKRISEGEYKRLYKEIDVKNENEKEKLLKEYTDRLSNEMKKAGMKNTESKAKKPPIARTRSLLDIG